MIEEECEEIAEEAFIESKHFERENLEAPLQKFKEILLLLQK
jgi:hypothetical protein